MDSQPILFKYEDPNRAETRKKRSRVVASCDNCRIKKIKCHRSRNSNPEDPDAACAACIEAGYDCTYDDRNKYYKERHRIFPGGRPSSGSGRSSPRGSGGSSSRQASSTDASGSNTVPSTAPANYGNYGLPPHPSSAAPPQSVPASYHHHTSSGMDASHSSGSPSGHQSYYGNLDFDWGSVPALAHDVSDYSSTGSQSPTPDTEGYAYAGRGEPRARGSRNLRPRAAPPSSMPPPPLVVPGFGSNDMFGLPSYSPQHIRINPMPSPMPATSSRMPWEVPDVAPRSVTQLFDGRTPRRPNSMLMQSFAGMFARDVEAACLCPHMQLGGRMDEARACAVAAVGCLVDYASTAALTGYCATSVAGAYCDAAKSTIESSHSIMSDKALEHTQAMLLIAWAYWKMQRSNDFCNSINLAMSLALSTGLQSSVDPNSSSTWQSLTNMQSMMTHMSGGSM